MAAFNIQEALVWKEKIESVIDQVHLLKTISLEILIIADCLIKAHAFGNRRKHIGSLHFPPGILSIITFGSK